MAIFITLFIGLYFGFNSSMAVDYYFDFKEYLSKITLARDITGILFLGAPIYFIMWIIEINENR